jgi:putative GTP pyrophosphokinase
MKKRVPSGSPGFPGGSKSRVNRAGDNIRNNVATAEDLRVIDEWRAAHRDVLNTFQAILRARASGENITVAQRHKRKRTVFDKLQRLPSMNLSRMDDVAGCRLIFKSTEELYEFRAHFHGARFKHTLRHDVDKYDYIKRPKNTGYRGVHDVYEYDVNSEVGKSLTGLFVEIQYRTLVQHAWSTANEVVGLITDSEPKFQRGDMRLHHAMALASEILSRAHEKEFSCFPELSDRDLVTQFIAVNDEVGLLQMLRSTNVSDITETQKNENRILMFSGDTAADLAVEVRAFRYATDALRALFELEKEFPDRDVVLVRAASNEGIRLAFKNYFFDARDFIDLVEAGLAALTKPKRMEDVELMRAIRGVNS